MARPFDFNSSAKAQARMRQDSKCAHCGHNLNNMVEHAHHVVPNQSGKPNNPAHAWLASAENCVILCDGCHNRVHQDGRFRTGAVAPPDYYPHSHGNSKQMQQLWLGQLNARARTIWP